jgi:exopolysaccharide production protein ExoZ
LPRDCCIVLKEVRASKLHDFAPLLDGCMELQRIQSIQILRGIAAVLVVWHHLALFFGPEFRWGEFPTGAFGVDIFFPISGFVIYLTAPQLDWRLFLTRRIARVAPIYWFATLVKVTAVFVVPMGAAGYRPEVWHFFASLLFLPAIDAGGRPFPPISLGWTLNFEMYFYLVSALTLQRFRTHFGLAVAIAIGTGTLIGCVLTKDVSPVFLLLNTICWEFLYGVLIAFLWSRGLRTPLWFSAFIVIVAIGTLFVFPDLPVFDPLRPLKWGLPGALIVWALLMCENSAPIQKFEAGMLLGNASYSIYVVHPLLIPIMGPLVVGMVGAADGFAFLLVLVSCVVTGAWMHLLLERRINRFFSTLISRVWISRGQVINKAPAWLWLRH